MHEVGIISSMLKTIEAVMEEEHLTKVEKIVLQVGELSGVLPHYMEECFPAAVYKTRFQDTKLELDIVPGIARCDCCGLEFNGLKYDLTCPDCGNRDRFTRLSGDELIIKEIQGY
ncbi:MAG: hydrogenase maturation nickel metallochaperone HypA [Clostridia bacterium]|nr:hydrogenase maturation nickel metallochaperone HypA [Clostridia bacterium]